MLIAAPLARSPGLFLAACARPQHAHHGGAASGFAV